MISKKESEKELRILFEKFALWNNIEIKVFMTDDFIVYSKLIGEYFPKATHLLCVWHIYKAWFGKLKATFGKYEPKIVFHDLIKIQRVLDNGLFETKLSEFLNN